LKPGVGGDLGVEGEIGIDLFEAWGKGGGVEVVIKRSSKRNRYAKRREEIGKVGERLEYKRRGKLKFLSNGEDAPAWRGSKVGGVSEEVRTVRENRVGEGQKRPSRVSPLLRCDRGGELERKLKTG